MKAIITKIKLTELARKQSLTMQKSSYDFEKFLEATSQSIQQAALESEIRLLQVKSVMVEDIGSSLKPNP
jgi:hypothetical protein